MFNLNKVYVQLFIIKEHDFFHVTKKSLQGINHKLY